MFLYYGIVLGIIFINHTSSSEFQEITSYIGNIKENIMSEGSIDKFSCFLESLKHGCGMVLLIWILGSTIAGSYLIYLVIAYKGFSVGYTISAIIASLGIKGGSVFVFSSLLLQNIIFLPAIFMLAESGVKFHSRIMKSNVNIKIEFIRYTIIMLIAMLFAVISGIVEVYVSTNLLIFLKKFI